MNFQFYAKLNSGNYLSVDDIVLVDSKYNITMMMMWWITVKVMNIAQVVKVGSILFCLATYGSSIWQFWFQFQFQNEPKCVWLVSILKSISEWTNFKEHLEPFQNTHFYTKLNIFFFNNLYRYFNFKIDNPNNHFRVQMLSKCTENIIW